MDRSTRQAPGEERSALFLGPGARLATLRPILAALFGPTRTIRSVEPLDALGELEGESGTLLLDADLLALEDLGWLRRLLARRPALRLVLVGDDPGRRGARSLLRLTQARWTSWPPDVEDLESIAGVARAAPTGLFASEVAAPAPQRTERTPYASEAPETPETIRRARAPSATHRASIDDDLAEIEAILELPLATERVMPRERSRDTAREPAFERTVERTPERTVERTPERTFYAPTPSSSTVAPPSRPVAESGAIRAVSTAGSAARPPKYFRAQVADLADIAQRIELSIEAVEDATGRDAVPEGSLDLLRGEVARLVQFTRTLGYLVAPPPPGEQVFDLGETIRVIVAGLVARGPESPRCLLRDAGTLIVRSDRQLLEQAFDAFFGLIQFAARTDEVVRIQWTAEETPALARIAIEFPAGPLEDLTPAEIVEPYGLRKRFPDLGANALSAAIEILRGQGGEALLRKTPAGRLEWNVTLPRHVEARHKGSPAHKASESDPASLARPEDPFA